MNKHPAQTSQQHPPSRLIIGISGASGVLYGIRLLELLKDTMIETHLVMSRTAELTLAYETDRKLAAVKALADHVHGNDDLAAPISSGSFLTLGMIVAPCSAKSLAEIASGVTPTLIARAADVVLKERRRLVLMLRETPLHLGHIRNMASVTEMGGIIAPPVPAMYAQPQSIEEMVDQSLGRVLDLFGLHLDHVTRWDKAAKKRR
ncbi:UbiX family flavin prenyltransferase [Dongia rigui]|uniref:Flavin prenyltransferase UbiX n=1 Tax=Dongia rigui TaxID=940149 RepID=A0ABU5E0D3_9PROT|nr:UbiX family flavin prenyltransferase [Dongia rigui]MDY0872737.1 UbiX family flavin prenyltransferase [Dongia rigui]